MVDATSLRPAFDFDEAFDRNIGWVTEREQQILRNKAVAIAGMGGVRGVHLLTLVRMGIGRFHIADLDIFELANFNRQVGANSETIGRPKVEVLAEMARAINPEVELKIFDAGVTPDLVGDFLEDIDLFVDGFDFFELNIRSLVFKHARELGIPALTAAPLGLGTAYLIFMPDGMSFEDYFRFGDLPEDMKYANFWMGLAPAGLQQGYLVDPSRLNLPGRAGPSSITACQLCSGVVGVEALKILLGRGKIWPAPYYQHFDVYRDKHVRGRLPRGNAGLLQRLKLRKAYKIFAALSRSAPAKPAAPQASALLRILDLARWAPSGDNSQPWRFEVTGEDSVTVHVRDESAHNVYEYNKAQPTFLSAGILLETMRIAASQEMRSLRWEFAGRQPDSFQIKVALESQPGVAPDSLVSFVKLRSVDRRPYAPRPLTAAQKDRLAATLAAPLAITWYERAAAKKEIAQLNSRATDIRLRIPEAYEVHREIIDWERPVSPDRIPAGALGLDALTLKVMSWAMRDWRRLAWLNRLPGATLGARMQMDLVPGKACAAHFAIRLAGATQQTLSDNPEALLKAGESLQRLWLTATAMGLVLQPALATLCFASYGSQNAPFTADPAIRRKAASLATELSRVLPSPEEVIFLGRLGLPGRAAMLSRSGRRPLSGLLVTAQQMLEAGEPEAEEPAGQEPRAPSPEFQVPRTLRG